MSARRREERREAKGRRVRTRRLVLAIVAGLVVACGVYVHRALRSGVRFTPAAVDLLGPTGREAVRDALEAYGERYGPPPQGRVVVDAAGRGGRTEVLPDGGISTTLATSESGLIDLVPNAVRDMTARRLRCLALHEATHASASKEASPLDPPLRLHDSSVAVAFSGFGVMVRTRDGEATRFTKIEEGVADALACEVDTAYSVQSAQYYGVGQLTRIVFRSRSLRPEDVQDLLERNDLWAYVEALLGRKPDRSSAVDLEVVMSAYQRAWDGEDPDAVVRKLLEGR